LISLEENLDSDGSSARFTIADDDLLDVLANYGSPTETHSFEAGSPAMDAAPDCTSTSGSGMLRFLPIICRLRRVCNSPITRVRGLSGSLTLKQKT